MSLKRIQESKQSLIRSMQARRFYEHLSPASWQERWAQLSNVFWTEHQGDSFLLLRGKATMHKRFFLALPISELQMQFKTACQSWSLLADPENRYAFILNVAGRRMHMDPIPSEKDDQALSPPPESTFTHVQHSTAFPWLQLHASIRHPDSLIQSSLRRRNYMGLLLGLACVTGLAGWWADRRAYRQQVQLNQMKSNFVASVSHELRTPIASVQLMTENLIRAQKAQDQTEHTYLNWIALECRRLASLVQNILQFSRLDLGKQPYEFEPVDTGRLIKETLQLMRPLAEHMQVQLICRNLKSEAGPPLPDATWDGQAMHQALVNLLDNALKHSPRHGTVSVHLDVEPDPSFLVIRIADQGPGIPEADRERIFQPFERLGSELTRRTKGVGIGLHLVWQTIQAHQGSIRVEQAPEGGSIFIVSLPIHPTPS